MKKAILIFSAILLGSIFNIGHQWTAIIRPNLMVMLFFAFLSITINWQLFQKRHFIILLVNVLTPLFVFCLFQSINPAIAQVAFILTVIPTGPASAVIANLLRANVLVTTGSIILTTLIIAFLLPFYLTYLLGIGGEIPIIDLVIPIFSIVFIPLVLSQGILKVLPEFGNRLRKFNFISFPLFLLNVFIACGNASHFIHQNLATVKEELIWIISLTTVICIGNFRIGRFIGRFQNTMAYELSMGRKNTMIGLWIAITYFSPIIALGPICYIVCHNAYNSILLGQMKKE